MMTPKKVIKIIKNHLNKNQPKNYNLKVTDCQKKDDTWFVEIVPNTDDRSLVNSCDYADKLTCLEEEIQEKELANIFLVPFIEN